LVDSLRKENRNLNRKLSTVGPELEDIKLKLRIVEAMWWEPKTPRSPGRVVTVEEMVKVVVGSEKRRRVGEVGKVVDPENA